MDPNDHITIDLSARQPVPSLAAEQFAWSVVAALAIAALVGVILLIRHRRAIAKAAGDQAIGAMASVVKAKRTLASKIEDRLKED